MNQFNKPWKVYPSLTSWNIQDCTGKEVFEELWEGDIDVVNHMINCVNFCGEYSDNFLQEMTLEALINHMSGLNRILQEKCDLMEQALSDQGFSYEDIVEAYKDND